MTWLTSAEAAEHARVSVYTIREAAERGDLEGVKVTLSPKPKAAANATAIPSRDGQARDRRKWRFRPEDVDAWLERGRVTNVRAPRRRRGAA